MLSGLKLYAILALVAVCIVAAGSIALRIRADGYNSRVVEEVRATTKRSTNANRADDAARRCAADPDCRLSNDGFRRD
jgi:hypothetical protein